MPTSSPIPPPFVDSAALPWAQVSPGFSLKVLRATTDAEPRVLMLRLDPGAVIERHHHAGDVHAYTLSGRRELIETGEVIGPGAYNYEPPGNVDSWRTVGEEAVVVLVIVTGAFHALDAAGNATETTGGESVAAFYRGHLAGAATRHGERSDA
jgi:2,4'-dihydroxyacetophenone dioxygenase